MKQVFLARALLAAALCLGIFACAARAVEVEPTPPDLDAEPVLVDVQVDWQTPRLRVHPLAWQGYWEGSAEKLLVTAADHRSVKTDAMLEAAAAGGRTSEPALPGGDNGLTLLMILPVAATSVAEDPRQWNNVGAVVFAAIAHATLDAAARQREAAEAAGVPVLPVMFRKHPRLQDGWAGGFFELAGEFLTGALVNAQTDAEQVDVLATVSADGKRSVLFIIRHEGRVALPSVQSLFGVDDEDELHFAGIDHKGPCGCEPDDATSRIVRPGYSLYLISEKHPD